MKSLFNKLLVLLVLGNYSLFFQDLKASAQMGLNLIEASKINNLREVKRLLKAGANIDIQDNSKDTALIVASLYGHIGIVKKLLIKGANPDLSDNYGLTALMEASTWNFLNIVKELVEYGADIDVKDKVGDTALSKAKGNEDTFKFLSRIKHIEENMSSIEVKNLSEEEKVIFAKRLINQNKFNLYPLVFEMLDSLSYEQLAQVFTERTIENLIKDYKNPENYNLGFTRHIAKLAKKHASRNLKILIDKLEEEQQRKSQARETFGDIYINS